MLLPLYSRFEIQYDFSIKNLPEFDKGVCGMEGQKKRRPPVLLLMILVLFLTVGGLALAVQSFGRYDTLLLEQSDSQLYGLARSVDRSVSGALEQFIGELDYLIRLENFTDAEADCLAGQPEELLQLLQNNPLIREALITDFLCLQDGRVLLSASGRTGYTFPVGGSLDGRDRVRPCVAENGTVYLSFQLEGERGLWYAALVDLSLFYRQVAGGLTTSPRDQILLLDAGGQVLLRQTGQEIRVELAADGLAGEPGLGFLLQCQREGQEGACFYEAEGYTARMAVIPAAGNNGIFAVGVSEDFDQVSRPIRRSALLLTTGGGTLTVATRPEGEFLCFQVSDTGSGISPEVLPHIFEPFFTTKERGKGTGLGLAIVRQVMEEHKGTITIDTAPGRGTTMLLRFPTITPPEEDT